MKLNIVSRPDDGIAFVVPPYNASEIQQRAVDYPLLTPRQFADKYGDPYKPVQIYYHGVSYLIDGNFCTNPFCRWFGMTQAKFACGRKSRYRLSGAPFSGTQVIACNKDPNSYKDSVGKDYVTVLSNWSLADEICRLSTNETVVTWDPEYQFHNPGCSSEATYSEDPKAFKKRGKSRSNSQTVECKECGKFTNILPSQRENFTYHQQRNDILPTFLELVLNRTPVKRTCEILKIGSGTYYKKLEWAYRRCLEFLEKHEFSPLQSKQFGEIWLSTDMLLYYLNNVRKKGCGGVDYDETEKPWMQTKIIASAEDKSRYVFRADVAYDWTVSLDDIADDTITYKSDHLHPYARRNERFGRFQFQPQPPTANDNQHMANYYRELHQFDIRRSYSDGLHVNSTYTTYAHFWLLRQLLNCHEWRIMTDDDSSLKRAFYAVYQQDMLHGYAHHFCYSIDDQLSRRNAFGLARKALWELKRWGEANGFDKKTRLTELAKLKLAADLSRTPLYRTVIADGSGWVQHTGAQIQHPLPRIDQGPRAVSCLTDASGYNFQDLAEMLLRVNNSATDAFFQQVRRRISILERPLVTARRGGKSYIYANFNPRYAQYVITILRTYYNFCVPFKSKDRAKEETPAQRLGIARDKFKINDILYLK